jgi:hypothetical protein
LRAELLGILPRNYFPDSIGNSFNFIDFGRAATPRRLPIETEAAKAGTLAL